MRVARPELRVQGVREVPGEPTHPLPWQAAAAAAAVAHPQPLQPAAEAVEVALLRCSKADTAEAAVGHHPGMAAGAEPPEAPGRLFPATAQVAVHEKSGNSAVAAQAAGRRFLLHRAGLAVPVQCAAYEVRLGHSSSRSWCAEGSTAQPKAPDSTHSQTLTAQAEGGCAAGAQLQGMLCHWAAPTGFFVPKSLG